MGDLPPFLKHHSTRNSKGPCISTIFEHPKLSGTADALWWPVTEDSDAPAVILFVPGAREEYVHHLVYSHMPLARQSWSYRILYTLSDRST
jgi:hypothetical protein